MQANAKLSGRNIRKRNKIPRLLIYGQNLQYREIFIRLSLGLFALSNDYYCDNSFATVEQSFSLYQIWRNFDLAENLSETFIAVIT